MLPLAVFLVACGMSDPEPETPPEPIAPTPSGPELRTGSWSASLESPGGPLPFGLDLSERDGHWDAWLINGEERQRVGATVVGAQLTLDLAPYDATIVAAFTDGTALDGRWHKVKRGTTDELPFHATPGRVRRFPALPELSEPVSIHGRWRADFDSEDTDAVLIVDQPEGGTDLTATFLTATGDYRFLEGSMEGQTLRLSTFDGSHAFLFHATLGEDGRLSGDFWSGGAWHETWTATRDDAVTLPDPLGMTRLTAESVDWSALSFPDLDGRTRSLDDPEWAGKPHLVQIMGSWCPNCNDQTELLVELRRKHPELGLVSIAFEHGEDPARNARIVKRYAAGHQADWTYLVGGLSDKDTASAALPILDRVRAYPTLLFVAADGSVPTIHTGFTGPAAAKEHAVLVASYEREIAALLARE